MSLFSCLSISNYKLSHLVSAGFDAAEGDELGECNVTPSGFAHMTHMLMSLAGGKLAVALEVRDFMETGFRSLFAWTGWLQSGLDLCLSFGGCKNTPRCSASRTSAIGRK